MEIRQEVEEMYAALKVADGRFVIEFDTEQEVAEYEGQVKAYCKLRPAGEIRYRRSPAKNLPKTTIQFRITDVVTKAEEATQAVKDAAAKANTATPETPAKLTAAQKANARSK
jgi:hypothetical protein